MRQDHEPIVLFTSIIIYPYFIVDSANYIH